MKISTRSTAKIGSAILLAAICLFPVMSTRATAQDEKNGKSSDYDRNRAVPMSRSRAEMEADRLVSLSADKIVSLLATEPGLLLECKKLLVRTAYAQGRVIDPDDLTDDGLFRLVRQDENTRVLFTREIESRAYVRAKPTLEERVQNAAAPETPQAMLAGTAGTSAVNPKSQEDLYWSQPQGNVPGPSVSPGTNPFQQLPQQTPPATLPANDPRRLLLLAQAQSAAGSGGGSNGNVGGMSPLGVDQLSPLLAANATGSAGFSGGAGMGMGQGDQSSAFGQGLGANSLMGGGLGMPGFGLGGNIDPYASTGTDFPALGSSSSTAPSSSIPEEEKQPSLKHRPNPYADIPALYDLYSQYARHSPVLDRFGMDIFRNGTGNLNSLPMDLPVGPDYVLGPGDGLNIDLFGGVAQRLRRVVDRQGLVALPDVGDVQVSGRTMGDVQGMVQAALRTQYRNVQADVSLTRLRSIRIYVVGDVEHAGAYDISSLSTALNAVYAAGGPTSGGSLRILRHYRGQQLLEQVDVYDLLLHGVGAKMQRLESGDTIQVPPLGAQVTLEGMVRRPAIYELNGEKTLAEVLQLAGGVLPSGTLRHVDVERLQAHETRTMLRLDIPENNNQESVTLALEDFKIQDGDKVQISPILPYADRTVYLDGHVFRPGKFAYQDGMKVTDLIKSYRDLLPEPYKQRAEIIRLASPDNTPEVLAFNLEDALAGKDGQDLLLKPFDTVRVYGRFDFEDPPIVTVTGEVRDPGDHVTNGVVHLRDAIFMAGGTTAEAGKGDIQVFRKTQDGKLQVISASLDGALAGDAKDDILLEPKDRVIVPRNLTRVDPPTVVIKGEVGRPGKYPLGDGLTAAGLVRVAGGLTRGAFTEEADLTSYMVQDGSKIVSDHRWVPIARALAGEPDTDVRLHDGDVLTIRQLTGWEDKGALVTIKGEVLYPGTYGIQEGECLSSIIQRAGGFRSDAYPYATIFQRVSVRELEEQNRSELIRRVKGEATEINLTPGGDQEDIRQATLVQYQITLEKLENTPPIGRLVVHISSNLKRWAKTSADIPVRAGDVIEIPKRSNMVVVDGSVYNPTAITYKPGKNAEWYLSQAGGPTQLANKKAVFVVRGDGAVIGTQGGLFSGGVEKAELQPGDMVVVPEKTFSISHKFQNTVQAAQIATAAGIAISAARTF
jgi:protein involved in polysaccharide export with SLBB domain